MFSRAIRKSVPLTGICGSCNRNVHNKLRNSAHLNLYHRPSDTRYISTTYLLFSAKRDTKEKVKEEVSEKDEGKASDNKQEVKDENAKGEKSDFNREEFEKKQKERREQSENKFGKKKEYFQEKENLFGKDLVLHTFMNAETKEKSTYLETIRIYKNQPGRKRERVPFIYASLKYMKEFGVEKDLEVYKQLIDIFPKETMVPTNQFQSMFIHYPKEQYCATAVLEQMEDNGVMPDPEMELQLLSIFGRHGMPLEKYWKMMYWMPKFKNLNPWPVPKPLPNDVLELARLAMQKISSVDIESVVMDMDTSEVEDSIDKTWIVSAMAPKQSELLLKHDKSKPIYVEGPFTIYVATKSVDYFMLRGDPPEGGIKFPEFDEDAVDQIENPYVEPKRTDLALPSSVHEQEDLTIFACCATGTSSKDSLLSWIRLLEKENPVLAEIPVIFTLKNIVKEERYIEAGRDWKRLTRSEGIGDGDGDGINR